MQTITEYLNGAASYVNVARKTFNQFVLINVQDTQEQTITLNQSNQLNPTLQSNPSIQSLQFPSWMTEPFTLFLLGLGFFFSFVYYTNNFVFHATALFYPAVRSVNLIQLPDSYQLTRTRSSDGTMEQIYLRYWFIYAMMTLASYLTDYLHFIIPFYYHIKFLITVCLVFSLEKKPEIINQIYSNLFGFLRTIFTYFGLK